MIRCLRIAVVLFCVFKNQSNASSLVNRPGARLDESDSNDNNWIFNEENLIDGLVQSKPVDQQEAIRIKEANRIKLYMDELADPCDDFYQYACGNWEKVHSIPEDHFEYNVFSLLQENLYQSLRELLSEKPTDLRDANNEPSAEDKAKYFYSSCMNTEMRQKLGEKPLLQFLKQYGDWPVLDPKWNATEFDWINLTAQLSALRPNSLLRVSIDGDLKDSEQNIIYIDEPTLALSRRDVYLLESNSATIEAYHLLIKRILVALNISEEIADKSANEIITFEKELAKIKTPAKDRMELEDLYNRMTVAELKKQYSKIDWSKYLNIIFNSEITDSTSVVLLSMEYMKKLPILIEKTDSKTIANYVLWRYVKDISEDLDERFEKANDEFSQVLTGQQISLPKWKKCVQYTNIVMGMAVGAMFVRRNFDETSKADVIQLTRELQQSFRDSLPDNTWIDQDTRNLAEMKANATTLQVGYPDSIIIPEKLNERYKGLIIEPDQYFQNSVNLAIFETRKGIRTRKDPVDKADWPGYPAVINAYFEQSKNRIIIPAGILQPPIYNRLFPRALNYGGIGVFVGHELTHGFDDTGRNFDVNGDMKQWWTNSSIDAFKEQAECFTKQYDAYTMNGKNVDGTLTKGENIADNGGIQQAYWSYSKWLDANPDQMHHESLPGLNITDRKLFYLGFAQVWCGIIRPEAIENKLESDSHSPGKYRVLGSLRNFEEFSKQFQCPLGSSMNPRTKCKLW